MDPIANPDERMPAQSGAPVEQHPDESVPHKKADATKEPLHTGHSAHDELVERALIGRPMHSYGHGMEALPQAMIYLVLVAALGFVLLALVWIL